jgi:hypothetical protein
MTHAADVSRRCSVYPMLQQGVQTIQNATMAKYAQVESALQQLHVNPTTIVIMEKVVLMDSAPRSYRVQQQVIVSLVLPVSTENVHRMELVKSRKIASLAKHVFSEHALQSQPVEWIAIASQVLHVSMENVQALKHAQQKMIARTAKNVLTDTATQNQHAKLTVTANLAPNVSTKCVHVHLIVDARRANPV